MDQIKAIFDALGPSNKYLIWDISLYVLFLLNVVVLMTLPDGSTLGTLLSIIVLIFIFIDKTFAFGHILKAPDPEYCHAKIFIGTYLIRATIFIAPLTIAGGTHEGKVRTAGIVAGMGGAIYMFMRWFTDQRDVDTTIITCFNTDVMMQNAGTLLVLARVVLRDRLLLGTVHRRIPSRVFGNSAAHEVEV